MRLFKIFILALIFLIASISAFAQGHKHDVLVPIGKYMAKGDAECLSVWFDENLEVCIFTKSCEASRSQARRIFKQFFKEHNPQSFNITHVAESRNMKHVLGHLHTGGESFAVTIFVSSEDNIYRIQQLKIERQ